MFAGVSSLTQKLTAPEGNLRGRFRLGASAAAWAAYQAKPTLPPPITLPPAAETPTLKAARPLKSWL